MKGSKWICCLLALVLLLGGILPLEARAIDSIDLTRKGSLRITFRYDGDPLEGAEFQIYRVAVPDEQCRFTATGAFAPLTGHVDLNKMDQQSWDTLAAKLASDVKAGSMAPDRTGRTDAQGVVRFTELELGLYLVLSTPHTQNFATFEQMPLLVMVPNRNQDPALGDIDTWVYDDVSVNGKASTAKNDLLVIKIWDDKDNADKKRPETLIIELLRNGVVYDTVELPVDGKWQYYWEDLEYGPSWTVREETGELLKARYKCGDPVRDDKGTEYIIWTITNKYIPPKPPKLPQTGQLWWPVPVLLSLGMLCILVGMIRRRGEKHEA